MPELLPVKLRVDPMSLNRLHALSEERPYPDLPRRREIAPLDIRAVYRAAAKSLVIRSCVSKTADPNVGIGDERAARRS